MLRPVDSAYEDSARREALSRQINQQRRINEQSRTEAIARDTSHPAHNILRDDGYVAAQPPAPPPTLVKSVPLSSFCCPTACVFIQSGANVPSPHLTVFLEKCPSALKVARLIEEQRKGHEGAIPVDRQLLLLVARILDDEHVDRHDVGGLESKVDCLNGGWSN